MPKDSLRRFWFVVLAWLGVTLIGVYASLTNGTFDIPLPDIIKTLLRIDPVREYDLVIFDFRLPRIVIGALVGIGLGIAGSAIQGITRNYLADPGILGINAGAGLAVVLYIYLIYGHIKDAGWVQVLSMPLFGMLGGILAISMIFLFARQRGSFDPQRLILVGIAIGSGFGALSLYISLKMNPRDFEIATVWLTGSVYSSTWRSVATILPWLILLVPVIWRKAHALDLFQLQEDSVRGLGVKVNKERNILLLAIAGIVSACVAVSGSIAFVGLLAPHIARRLVGIHYRKIIPVSGVVGMAMVVVADFIGKTVFAPAELPVGIVLSIIGVPYFVYLLLRR